MTHDLSSFKSYLPDYVNTITTRSKSGFYVCPLCGSGTKSHKTGAFSITKDEQHWTCFGCNKGGDIFDLCAQYEHITAKDAAKRIIDLYGSAATQTNSPRRSTAADHAKAKKKPEEKSVHDFSADIARYATALPGSAGESYLQDRGFTQETMQRFKLGYNAARGTIVIPYNLEGTYYIERSIKEKNFFKLKRDLAGIEPVFNAAALYSSDVVFVTESPLCAISITQAGCAAVALNGTGFTKLINQLKKKSTNAVIVSCLDNDDAGREATEELGKALEEINVYCVDGTAAIMGVVQDPQDPQYLKDPNEVLQKIGADELKAAVEETVEAAREARNAILQEQENERAQRTGAGMVDSFLEVVQTEKYKPMPTGISKIDLALFGGFTRQQVVMLGAAPGAGKTALAQWIFEGMAQRGTPCVYVNLEMSREQLLARSISRIAARRGRKVTTLEVMQGYKWTDEQRAAILAAAQEYKDKIAPRFIMNPDGINADLDTILAYIEKEAQMAETAGEVAPVCVLDYLQLVSGQPREDAATVIKRAVAGLKAYAVKHNSLVFVIIAHNRKSNSSGDVSMESGRDTSAIEYSADLQLALTFTGCLNRDGKKGKAPEDLTPEEQKQITLRIVKGRFGGRGTDVDLHFDGATMTFKQLDHELVEVNVQTPWGGKIIREI